MLLRHVIDRVHVKRERRRGQGACICGRMVGRTPHPRALWHSKDHQTLGTLMMAMEKKWPGEGVGSIRQRGTHQTSSNRSRRISCRFRWLQCREPSPSIHWTRRWLQRAHMPQLPNHCSSPFNAKVRVLNYMTPNLCILSFIAPPMDIRKGGQCVW